MPYRDSVLILRKPAVHKWSRNTALLSGRTISRSQTISGSRNVLRRKRRRLRRHCRIFWWLNLDFIFILQFAIVRDLTFKAFHRFQYLWDAQYENRGSVPNIPARTIILQRLWWATLVSVDRSSFIMQQIFCWFFHDVVVLYIWIFVGGGFRGC